MRKGARAGGAGQKIGPLSGAVVRGGGASGSRADIPRRLLGLPCRRHVHGVLQRSADLEVFAAYGVVQASDDVAGHVGVRVAYHDHTVAVWILVDHDDTLISERQVGEDFVASKSGGGEGRSGLVCVCHLRPFRSGIIAMCSVSASWGDVNSICRVFQ